MDFIKQPMEIENRSMEIIAPHLEGLNLSPEGLPSMQNVRCLPRDLSLASH